ncbi:MAG: hypothetical protein KKC64_01155, partial [Spirochaetes bacterium]|nr:hypothetical protein [Spirochaetota bacterium]
LAIMIANLHAPACASLMAFRLVSPVLFFSVLKLVSRAYSAARDGIKAAGWIWYQAQFRGVKAQFCASETA